MGLHMADDLFSVGNICLVGWSKTVDGGGGPLCIPLIYRSSDFTQTLIKSGSVVFFRLVTLLCSLFCH